MAFKYKLNSVGCIKPQHELMGEAIRLTHAPREVRLAAVHHIRDLLMLILESVRYNKSLSECSLERIVPLRQSLQEHYDAVVDL